MLNPEILESILFNLLMSRGEGDLTDGRWCKAISDLYQFAPDFSTKNSEANWILQCALNIEKARRGEISYDEASARLEEIIEI